MKVKKLMVYFMEKNFKKLEKVKIAIGKLRKC